MMNKSDRRRIRRLAARDQFVELFKEKKKRLCRINEEGPSSKKDIFLIKDCVAFTVNELAQHTKAFKKYKGDLDLL